ncbi:hypothetical protein A9762_09585 [Pandoraea sp. ISTKB]|nr:hypothetical protein A9762_09585 [Pandoraea sp. ISTKB]
MIMTQPSRAGTLDPTFGNGGYVDFPLANGVTRVQSNGNLLSAGRWFDGVGVTLVRHLPDGAPDPAFGEAGRVIVPFYTHPDHGPVGNFKPADVVVQPDGKIVVGGHLAFTDFEGIVMFARITSDGRLDTTFGNAGFTLVNMTGGNKDETHQMSVRPDGRILATAFSGNVTAGGLSMLCQLAADGTMDFGFGHGGLANAYPLSSMQFVLRLRADGKFYTSGFGLTRYDERGTADRTFGNNGHVPFGFFDDGRMAQATGMVIMPDGRIVCVGNSVTTGDDQDPTIAWCWRTQANGSPDATFNNGIPVLSSISESRHANLALAVQPDGKMVCAGSTYGAARATLERLNLDGTRDATFGDGGIVIADPPTGGIAISESVHVLPDGKLLTSALLLGTGVASQRLSRYLG